jgi:hypothetical protein
VYFYQGLTASAERERKRNMSLVFRSLGQVAHLLQDAAQPQHTRNDSHATGSLYETYTSNVLPDLTFSGYPSVAVATPDQLWTTPDGKGIADYSNRGFVSAGSNLGGTQSGNNLIIQPNPNFPCTDPPFSPRPSSPSPRAPSPAASTRRSSTSTRRRPCIASFSR